MKKLMLLLGILSMGFQCEPPIERDMLSNYGEWSVKNSTSQTLSVKYGTAVETIPAGGTIRFYSDIYAIWAKPEFDDMLARWGNWADENITFEVLSARGTSLALWRYVEKEDGGRQFFNSGSWILTQTAGTREDELRYIRVFEIKSEDIAL